MTMIGSFFLAVLGKNNPEKQRQDGLPDPAKKKGRYNLR